MYQPGFLYCCIPIYCYYAPHFRIIVSLQSYETEQKLWTYILARSNGLNLTFLNDGFVISDSDSVIDSDSF